MATPGIAVRSGLLLALLVAAWGCSRVELVSETAPQKVRVLARAYLSQAPLLIADEEGYFAEEGIEVEFLSLAHSLDGLPALIQGDLDVIASGLNVAAYLNAIARGGKVRIVADKGFLDPDGCTYLAFVTRPELLRNGELMVPDPSSGRRLRVSWSPEFEHGTALALAELGLGLDDVELVPLQGAEELQALVGDRIDLATNTGEPVRKVVESGQAAVWRSGQSVLPGFQFGVLLYGTRLLDRDPDLGVRFMAAYLRGVRQYNQGKTDRNLEILASRTGFDRGSLEQACFISIRDDARIDLRSVNELQAWAVARGTLARAVREEEFWEPRFVEDAWARLGGDTPSVVQ